MLARSCCAGVANDAPGEVASERTRLTKALQGSRTLHYVYDFGDSWDHRIKVEKTFAPDPQIKLPWCIDGAGATPPEDCGGIPGYYRLLDILANKRHPEHREMLEWLERPYDAEVFDPNPVNRALERYFSRKPRVPRQRRKESEREHRVER